MIDESPELTPERFELAAEYGRKAELARQRGAVSAQQLPEPVHAEPVIGERVTSPELAKLAAKYLNFDDAAFETVVQADKRGAASFCADVRRLAASVLSQAEGGAK